jgi:predicted nucleic acid-binding protein
MIVADSSYIIEGLLKDSSLLDDYEICSPDYGIYEVLNAIWKHQVVLRQIKDSEVYVATFFDLIAAGRIRFMALEEETIKDAFKLAVKTKSPFYDLVFVALARALGVELKTFDKKQAELFKKA